MMFKWSLAWLLTLLTLAAPVHSQVIEIDSEGETIIFDGPTLSTDESQLPVIKHLIGIDKTLSLGLRVAQVEKDYGLPVGLVDAVIYQESRGRMNAVSSKGALGLMQLMPATAAELGVNPYDSDQNIRGGPAYLKRQIDRFGSIPLALAAYNAGPGAVLRYGGIPPYNETRNYVATIMGRWQPTNAPSTVSATVANTVTAPLSNQFFIEVSDQ